MMCSDGTTTSCVSWINNHSEPALPLDSCNGAAPDNEQGPVKTWDVSPSVLKTVSVSPQKADGGQHQKRDTRRNARAPNFAIPHTNLQPTQTEVRDLDQWLATQNPSPRNFREWMSGVVTLAASWRLQRRVHHPRRPLESTTRGHHNTGQT